jgi:hypothetical protein
VAVALGVNPLSLCNRSVTELVELEEETTCRFCGAPLVERNDRIERFECGAESGWTGRPCPKDPKFPMFEEYRIECFQEGERVWCHATGLTPAARSVELGNGSGLTQQAAIKWIERSYIAARDGYEAAEQRFPFADMMS